MLDPTEFVQQERRLFIDTNVFMDTDTRRAGGLKRLFERCQDDIARNSNPIVVPTKVVDELTKQSRTNPAGLTDGKAAAVRKATNSLTFLESVAPLGLVRKDLGDNSNPYADDLFVEIFTRVGGKYEMCLLTHDITLLLRIRLLAAKTNRRLVAGGLSKEGQIEVESDQVLFEKGARKLERMQRQIRQSIDVAKSEREAASLEPLLDDFQHTLGVSPAARQPAPSHTPSPATVARPEGTPCAFSSPAKFRGPDHVLGTTTIPREGDTVRFGSATSAASFTLGRLLGEGGEGQVYEVAGQPNRVAKIFDAEHRTAHRQAKLVLLTANGLARPGIAFPSSVITTMAGDFVGYAMPRAEGKEFQSTLMRPKRFRETYPNWSKADLVDVCISFLERVVYLHSLNVLLGDINPKNLMVEAKKTVWIIDADSWQLEGYPCPVGTAMFTAPTVKGDYADNLRTMEEELFAVATMLFMVLITGQFPYSRAGTDGDIPRLIKEGKFAFQFHGKSDQDQPGGKWKYMWSHLPFKVKSLFWHTFHRDGDRYTRRPTAGEWLQVFREYKAFFGSADDFDPMSNDVYPSRFKAFRPDTPIRDCPQCHGKNAIVGEWDDDQQSYFEPELCFDCSRQNRHRQQPRPPQNTAMCKSCGRSALKSSMTYGHCAECAAKGAQLDPAQLCIDCRRPFITFDHADWFKGKGLAMPKSHVTATKQQCPPTAPSTKKPRTQPIKPSTQPQKSLLARLFGWFWN
ncbi:hypothetical protein K2F54_05195 [Cryobacterium sp. 1639]|uniref:protein kinase domain-containing protein n=1 Tax=Cryobacterium inferilacus TaxID=2866629 RepID=UPI001C72DA77|nr:hypothetical protein [Cryobacterium sp. 1639]MBX0299371.1 hypothetical protein [Cryobacterium sp. 1639]